MCFNAIGVACAHDICHLFQFNPLHARVKIISYLHNAFAESEDLDKPVHMHRLISGSVIPSSFMFYLPGLLHCG